MQQSIGSGDLSILARPGPAGNPCDPPAGDGPEHLVALLRASSPARMRSFALAMHEIQCERGDLDHADLWQAILRLTDEQAVSKSPSPAYAAKS